MHVKSLRIRNFRRLIDVTIDLEMKTTVFVGANNSGKTSATQVLRCFLDPGAHYFTFHDLSASTWDTIDAIGESDEGSRMLPKIVLDIWFQVSEVDLHQVVSILPSLEWSDQPIGVSFEFGPNDASSLVAHYRELRDQYDQESEIRPWPLSLTDYLRKEIRREYGVKYFVIEADKLVEGEFPDTYEPLALGDSTESAQKIIGSLMRVDFLDAQRFLSDADSRGRSQDLSRRLSSFYRRNLEKVSLDSTSRLALAQSEKNFDKHMEAVFKPTLERLENLGYPGFSEPRLVVRSALNSEKVVSQNAAVHYELHSADSDPEMPARTLPDRYSGLGFKNLIYMVVELLDFRAQWESQEVDRPALHLILIEEPEVHLHVQLQQVFIKKIFEVVAAGESSCSLQMVVTTHSPHIIDENDYAIVRYFRRHDPRIPTMISTSVLNLAELNSSSGDRDFLKRYLKITHCDLFFADGAILVEGNVERLLLPLMIQMSAPNLSSKYLTVLEVGGSFAHKFAPLVNMLGIPMLIVTDLDSVDPAKKNSACLTLRDGSVTSNGTLKKWLPARISELLEIQEESKAVPVEADSEVVLRLAYQTRSKVIINNVEIECAGRTFEEAFAFDNFDWIKDHPSVSTGFGLTRRTEDLQSPVDYLQRIHENVRSDFKKTEFALEILTSSQGWSTPDYIRHGLEWLDSALMYISSAP